jgi:type IX secretion system PorP/SprF family membrane protein
MNGRNLNFLLWIIAFSGILLAVSFQASAQQRSHYTQYMYSGLVINPAYAGADEALSATFIDRHQWIGVDGAPVTQTFTLHGLNQKKRVGLGLILSNDKIGIHQNFTAQLSYAYHLQIAEKSYLSFGLQAGVVHVNSNYGSLIPSGSTDPKLNNALVNQLFFDMGAGIYLRSPKFHAGISSPELLPKSSSINDTTSFNLKSVNLFGFLKYRIPISHTWDIEPAVLIKYFSDVPLSMDATMTFIYKEVLTAGVSYRMNESFAYLVKLRVTPQLQVGYAYDNPLQSTSKLSNGSHELMIQYLFRFERSGIKSPRL